MVSKAKIDEAVRGLDSKDDGNWTSTGLPSVDAVSSALGERVTREDITNATGITRDQVQDPDAATGQTEERAGQRYAANATEPSPGGGMERDPVTGKLVPSDGGSQTKAAAASQIDYRDMRSGDGPEPNELFEALDRIVAAVSSPRYRRNQFLQQVALMWQNGQREARAHQDKMEGRIDRRSERRSAPKQGTAEDANDARI